MAMAGRGHFLHRLHRSRTDNEISAALTELFSQHWRVVVGIAGVAIQFSWTLQQAEISNGYQLVLQSIEDHGDSGLTWSERGAVTEEKTVTAVVEVILRLNPAPIPHAPTSGAPEVPPRLPPSFEREAASHQPVHPLVSHRPTPSASIELPPL